MLKKQEKSFGQILDKAQQEPVAIHQNGRPVAVVLSYEDYERLEALEDAWWAMKAETAAKEGDWLGSEESEQYMRDVLNASD